MIFSKLLDLAIGLCGLGIIVWAWWTLPSSQYRDIQIIYGNVLILVARSPK